MKGLAAVSGSFWKQIFNILKLFFLLILRQSFQQGEMLDVKHVSRVSSQLEA